jgi:probable F420-dependent oxidoreductase
MPRLGLFMNRLHRTLGSDLRCYVEAARIADQAGVDLIEMPDHVVMGTHVDRYPYGTFPTRIDEPWSEPLTMLAAMSSVTSNIRLGTSVFLAPLRPAAFLAKQLATLDVMSGGRLELGIGTGWQREEYEALGLDWQSRYRLLDHVVRSCRALWTGELVSVESEFESFTDIICRPMPAQARIPLNYGVALKPGNIRRIVELGDGWWPLQTPPEVLGEGRLQLREAFAAAGRDPDSLTVRVHLNSITGADGTVLIEETLEEAPLQAQAGATIISIGPPTGLGSLADLGSWIERLVTRWRALGL